jgi:hypothetical protein
MGRQKDRMKLRECLRLSLPLMVAVVALRLPTMDCRLSIGKGVSHKSSIFNRQSTIAPAKTSVAPRTATSGAETAKETKLCLTRAYSKLPLSFEGNQGQVDGRVKFLSRARGYTLFLTSMEAVLQLWNADLQIAK